MPRPLFSHAGIRLLVAAASVLTLLLGDALLHSAHGQNRRAKAAETELPQITDPQAFQLLDASQRAVWNRALALRKEGEDDVESGNWLLARDNSGLGFQRDLREVHAEGRAQVERGEEKIALANAKLDELRLNARERYVQVLEQNKPKAYTFLVPSAQWPGTHQGLLEAVLQDVWGQGYTRVFFAGHHVLDSEGYYHPPRLNAQADKLIDAIDADRFTYKKVNPKTLKIGSSGDRLQLEFPESKEVGSNQRAAVLIGEILPFAQDTQYLFSVRAIELDSLEIVSSVERIVASDEVVEATFARALDIESGEAGAFDEDIQLIPTDQHGISIARVNPESTADGTLTSEAMEVTLDDVKRFIQRLEQSRDEWMFGLSFDQNGSVLPHRDKRRAILMAKLLLLSNGGPAITDTDFLRSVLAKDTATSILSVDERGNLIEPTEAMAPENALWVVTHERGPDGRGSLVLKAERLDGSNRRIEVGPIRFGGRSTTRPTGGG
ncbi:MAG: hypothetical protein ACFBZ8_11735 [Opitutales bacterium]